MEHPPPVSHELLEAGKQAISDVHSNNFSSKTLSILYYPLQQVPLPSFIIDTLVWNQDTLKIIKGVAVFDALNEDNDAKDDKILGYKRTDDYTVLCVVKYNNNYAVFTNEIAQSSWELVGLFGTKKPVTLLDFSTYDTFEEDFLKRKQSKDTKETSEEDSYWNRYDKEEEPQCSQQQPAKTDDDYWDSYDKNQSYSIADHTEANIRPEAVDALFSLIGLYQDCGITDKNTIANHIMSVAFGTVNSHNIPDIAHRHTIRTWEWISQNESCTAELMVIIKKIQQQCM